MTINAWMSRFKIGTRVFAGFGAVLVLLALVAVIGIRGMWSGESAFESYDKVADNSRRVVGLAGDVGEMRRMVVLLGTDGDQSLAPNVRSVGARLITNIAAAVAASQSPQEKQMLSEMSRDVEAYLKEFEAMAKAREAGDKALNEQMNPLASKARQNITEIIKSAMADNDYEAAAYAGLTQEQLALARINALRFLTNGDAKAADTAKQYLDSFGKTVDTLLARLENPTRRRLAEETKAIVPKYAAAFSQVIESLGASHKLWSEVMAQRALTFAKIGSDVTDVQSKSLDQLKDDTIATFDKSVSFGLVLSLVALALGMVAAFLIARGITRPVSGMTTVMEKLASGDLSVAIPATEQKDEVGQMARTVEVFKQSMVETERLRAEQAKEQAIREERAKTIEAAVTEFEAAAKSVVGIVSSSASEMQASAESLSATAEETARQATAVAAASEQASSNVQTVATAGEELSSSISEIGRQVGQSTRITGQAVEEAERTNSKVQGLAEAALRIGDVVKLINDIAGQTNLLALNATIEAARAGEAGKGFAVVASEVKSLANQTAKATDEIGAQISSIQAATKDSVDAIQSIGRTIGEVNEIATTIAAAVEEQGAATSEIARNVQEAARGTQEVSSNIGGVTQASAATGSAASQVLSAAGELAQQAETLRTRVDTFLAKVRAA